MFDEVAELYDRVRPGYPDELLSDLTALTGVGPGSRILEIGCGTGQLTLPLARSGVGIVAVELGVHLAAIARRNLATLPGVEVVTAAFEDWPLPPEPFDLIVSATAFHWLDPDMRVTRCAEALRPGGALAVIDTHHIAGGTPGFVEDSQRCYERWEPDTEPGFRLPTAEEIDGGRALELESSLLFGDVSSRRYVLDLDHTAESFVDLLRTYSNIRGMEARARKGLLTCLADLINERYGGRIVKAYLLEMCVGRLVACRS